MSTPSRLLSPSRSEDELLLRLIETDPARIDELYYLRMRTIRIFEQTLLEMFSRNELFGTTHTCIGQEANAVGLAAALDLDRDIVWASHRCHGHFIAYGGPIGRLFAEIMGRRTGVCGGRGGSQHLCWRNFYSNGIQGGIAPLAVGCAMAEKAEEAVVAVFLGDGTTGEGALYESLNMASLWGLPVLFVVEDNGIAQTTPRSLGVSGSIAERARPFGIACHSYRGTDVRRTHALACEVVAEVRRSRRPAWLHLETVRLGPHSKGDDTRTEPELALLRALDPLATHGPRIADKERIDTLCQAIVTAALEEARAAPIADGS